MSTETQVKLQQIRRLFREIGDRLSAIDHYTGDSMEHWQKITENDENVREAEAGLPAGIRSKCPEMMKYVNAGGALQFKISQITSNKRRPPMGDKFKKVSRQKAEYRFRIKAANRGGIATGEGHTSKSICKNGIESVNSPTDLM